jgi:iron-sulfur cluster repair protein YtfE (RIC family)
MSSAVEDKDPERLLSAGETLLILMQQHNMKEEQMLYPMADEVLGAEIQDLLKALALY